jgi:hypothetical protein
MTRLVWPMRYARSTLWLSVAGFHAGSTMMTRSAAVIVRPRPPTCAAWAHLCLSRDYASF